MVVRGCPFCARVFDSQVDLHQHSITVHHKNIYFCSKCPLFYLHTKERDSHYKKNHRAKQTVFPCNQCSATFRSNLNRKDHKEKIHSIVVPSNRDVSKKEEHFCCQAECGRVFTRRGSLLYHTKVQHQPLESRVLCTICNKSYKNAEILQWHMRSTLSHRPEISEVFCVLCHKRFLNKNTYYWHVRKSIEHKQALEKIGDKPRMNEKNKEYGVCQLCNKTYTRKDSFDWHMKHSKEHWQRHSQEKRERDKLEELRTQEVTQQAVGEGGGEEEEEELRQILNELLPTETMHTCVWCIAGEKIQYTWDDLTSHFTENHLTEVDLF